MSQENVGIVRSVYEAWGRNELPGPSDLLDPEIEYVNPPGAIEPGTRRGIEAFGQAVRAMVDGWESWEIELERFVPAGERVAVIVNYRVQGRVSGVDVNAHESALWTVRDGKVVRYEWFHRADDALEAVGRPE